MSDPVRSRTQLVIDGVIAQTVAALIPVAGTKPRLAVELYPDSPETYRLTHPVGALLVRQVGDVYEPPQASGMRSGGLTGQRARPQERVLVLRVTLMFRQLNGRDGITAVLDELKDALWGFMPEGSRGPLHFVGSEHIGVADGIWEHALDVAVPMWESGKAV